MPEKKRYGKIRIRECDIAYRFSRNGEPPKSVLIHMPDTGHYKRCAFWHPASLLFPGTVLDTFLLSYDAESWEFIITSEDKNDESRHDKVASIGPRDMEAEWAAIDSEIRRQERLIRKGQKVP